jgi:predicted membrane-bound spermidine synthase
MAWNETLLFYKESPYQRIAFFNESDGSLSLTLNDFWQFNSNCEHIYHECLFTMPGLFPNKLENVLVLGGGDGLGARELLKYKSIKNIDLVDLDPEIIKFAKTNVFMKNLNKDSFNDPKVNITVTDATKWLERPVTKKYDLVIIDFPDPTTDLLWGLYTVKLYKQVAARLSPHGVVAIQSSTYNTKTFELIYERLDKVFPFLLGYHTGASRVFCGFFLCSFKPIKVQRPLPKNCRWMNPDLLNQILALPLMKVDSARQRLYGKNNSLKNPSNFVQKIRGQMTRKPSELGETAESKPAFDPQKKSEFFDREVIAAPQPEGPSLLKNPLVIGGIATILVTPLILRYI